MGAAGVIFREDEPHARVIGVDIDRIKRTYELILRAIGIGRYAFDISDPHVDDVDDLAIEIRDPEDRIVGPRWYRSTL